jgi:hypothetical protein
MAARNVVRWIGDGVEQLDLLESLGDRLRRERPHPF